MRDLFELAREPTFQDAKEREFCLISLDRVERGHAVTWYIASVLFWQLGIVATWFYDFSPITRAILLGCGISLSIAKIIGVSLVKNTTRLRQGQLIGFVISNIVMFAAATFQPATGTEFGVVMMIWGLGSTLALGILAYRNYVHIFALIFFLVSFGYCLYGHEYGLIGLIFTASMAIIISNAHIIAKRFIKLELMKSYRQHSVYTPRQVLLEAIRTKGNLIDIFKPESRYCVCVCSDWRGFQAFSSTVTPEVLALALESYYDLQINLLDQTFPEGNYFIDWIADELFVVGFVTPTCDKTLLLEKALNFSIRSVQARSGFFQIHQAPTGLDVGISAGFTTVGMLGPAGNKKATALGQVPGTARRLQTLAKELRPLYGDLDRVVLDSVGIAPETAERFGLRLRKVPAGMRVRDISVAEVACFEVDDQPAAALALRA